MNYTINYYWIKCNLCDRIASVFGYVFDDNIATVNNNTIKFPEKLKENEMFICILKDKRIIIASKEEIEFTKTFVDYGKVKISDDGILTMESPVKEIDTGSFLKGYAISKAREVLKDDGIKRLFSMLY